MHCSRALFDSHLCCSYYTGSHLAVRFYQGTILYDQGPVLLSEVHVKFNASKQGFYNMASGWLTALLPASQMPGLKICVN